MPAATPKDIVAKLGTELQKAIETPAIKAKIQEIGLEPTPSDASAMTSHWTSESKYWPKLIRERQITLD